MSAFWSTVLDLQDLFCIEQYGICCYFTYVKGVSFYDVLLLLLAFSLVSEGFLNVWADFHIDKVLKFYFTYSLMA